MCVFELLLECCCVFVAAAFGSQAPCPICGVLGAGDGVRDNVVLHAVDPFVDCPRSCRNIAIAAFGLLAQAVVGAGRFSGRLVG